MKRFTCVCGQTVFFDNTRCFNCGRTLGHDPLRAELLALEPSGGELWHAPATQIEYRHCRNRLEHGNCNWLIESRFDDEYCLACQLNETIPDLSAPENLPRWARLERAKRRLIYHLMQLGLPLNAPVAGFPRGLSFRFLEDSRSRPEIDLEWVTTGHDNGVITLNVLEADDVQRVWQRELSGELYRTLLGHFRHESGHYYFELLAHDRAAFASTFGNPDLPYAEMLKSYYLHGPLAGWEGSYISAYASAHPHEDWAESFAHYQHILDTLETARARGLLTSAVAPESFRDKLAAWDGVSATLNELNRSLGLRDAYPFVISTTIAAKLEFVDAAVRRYTGS
ncbi:MAG: putative zinc-binding metallopeptidase [Thiotrichales bacterium]